MSEKKVTCRVCGSTDVYWRQSAKGKWYLATTRYVSTSYGGNYALPRAHSLLCAGAPKTLEEYRAEYIALIAGLDQELAEFDAGLVEPDWRLECRRQDREVLRAELARLEPKKETK
jgi:hypothetical protein